MSLWTCHPAHAAISWLLILAGGAATWCGLDNDYAMACVLPGVVLQVNGLIAMAYQVRQALHPGVWRLAAFASVTLNLLFLVVGWQASRNGAITVVTVALVATIVSMQLSFLWEHRPFRIPQSELRN